MIAAAAPALPSRRVLSVKRRKSPAASSSSGYAVGNSRASTGSSGAVVGPEKSSSVLERVVGRCAVGRLVAQQLDQLRRRASAAGRPRTRVKVATLAPLRRCRLNPLMRQASAFCIVAHRPYSCIACTSRSISSRLPVETTDRPSSCTSIISFSAFALE